MTFPSFHSGRPLCAAVLLGVLVAAQTAWTDEPSAIDYVYAMPRIWKSSAKDFDFSTSSPLMPQPGIVRAPSNFGPFLEASDPSAPKTDKPSLSRPWEQLRKSAPNQRWRPLAPVEEPEPGTVTDVAMRFWDEGATRLYR
jgi:hypothetical protein